MLSYAFSHIIRRWLARTKSLFNYSCAFGAHRLVESWQGSPPQDTMSARRTPCRYQSDILLIKSALKNMHHGNNNLQPDIRVTPPFPQHHKNWTLKDHYKTADTATRWPAITYASITKTNIKNAPVFTRVVVSIEQFSDIKPNFRSAIWTIWRPVLYL